ncbi:MAG: head-tail adaptor protein [Rickettsiales bacterium]
MRAGLTDRRVTIEELTEAEDAYGGAAEIWTTRCVASAQLIAKAGRERFTDKGFGSEIDAVFRLRRIVGVSPKMHRVRDGKAIYDIFYVTPPDRRDVTELHCVRRYADD